MGESAGFIISLKYLKSKLAYILVSLSNKFHPSPSRRWYLFTLTKLYIKNFYRILFIFNRISPNRLLTKDIRQASHRIRDNKKWESLTKGHLGCGDIYLRSYTNVDLPLEYNAMSDYHEMKVDKRAFLHDLNIFQDSSLDVIEMYHVFEHIKPWKIREVMQEVLRVLKPGGELALECPDIFKCSMNYLIDSSNHKISTMGIYGDSKYALESNMHYAGYSQETLFDLLNSYGFDKSLIFNIPARRWKNRDLQIVAFKNGIDKKLARKHAMERIIADTIDLYQLK